MSEQVFDLLIINGKIVSPEGIRENYLAVKDGKIVEEGVNPEGLKATRVIDAKGKHILPGGIDDHVHFRDPGDDLTYKMCIRDSLYRSPLQRRAGKRKGNR